MRMIEGFGDQELGIRVEGERACRSKEKSTLDSW